VSAEPAARCRGERVRTREKPREVVDEDRPRSSALPAAVLRRFDGDFRRSCALLPLTSHAVVETALLLLELLVLPPLFLWRLQRPRLLLLLLSLVSLPPFLPELRDVLELSPDEDWRIFVAEVARADLGDVAGGPTWAEHGTERCDSHDAAAGAAGCAGEVTSVFLSPGGGIACLPVPFSVFLPVPFSVFLPVPFSVFLPAFAFSLSLDRSLLLWREDEADLGGEEE
jgi:hypothetical protein